MRKNSNGTQAPKEKPADVVRAKISGIALRIQANWADWLARKTAKMSKRTLYISLGLFVVAGTTYNSMVFTGHLGSVAIRPGKIRMPTSSTQFRIPETIDPMELGTKDLATVHAYLDSLRRTPQGKVVIDSIFKTRPGLLDSINTAKEMMRKH